MSKTVFTSYRRFFSLKVDKIAWLFHSFVFCLLVFAFLPLPTWAQTGPLEEEVTVSATVPDSSGPTTPILIAPSNGSYVTDSTPSFVWEESTDDQGMSHYQLSLDGSVLFSNIPLTSTENDDYTLTYDSINDEYTLTPKEALTDGTHTWKVRAVDIAGFGTDSATWSFTLDTLAPSYVITDFGELTVNISAQDTSTIPTSPLELTENEPELLGTGEANASVQATLTIPDDPTQNFSFTIDTNGNWGLQLDILPRDVVMTLDFTITDTAGNVSILQGVEFVIVSEVIVFPPASPSPTPSPEATPIPGVTPEPTPPVSPEPPPIIEIPVIPPREIVNETVQELLESIPAPVTNLVRNLPQPIKNVGRALAPYSGALVASAAPTFSLLAIASQFGGNLSFNLILRILQALGLIPAGKPQGLVFNSQTSEPVPFALLTITNEGSNKTPVLETVVTDVEGVYSGIQLAPDVYRLSVSHQEYAFPAAKPRPPYMVLRDYYRGEPFTVASGKEEQLFLIPVDPLLEESQTKAKYKWRLFFARLSRLGGTLIFPIWVLSGILTMLYPTWLNWLVFGVYTVVIVIKALRWFKIPRITGQVIDDQGQPVANVVIRLSLPEANELVAVVHTNQQGEFALFVPGQKYQLGATHKDYVWAEAGTTLSFNEIDATATAQHLLITMKPVGDVYEELFGT
ncbi:MAG TPA: Ig-like domain-containing protein [Patescibacteria group bacterium]